MYCAKFQTGCQDAKYLSIQNCKYQQSIILFSQIILEKCFTESMTLETVINTFFNIFFPWSCLQVTNRAEAHLELNSFRRKCDHALVIKGDSLEVGILQYIVSVSFEFPRY